MSLSITTNPLLCDPEKGVCEIPGAEETPFLSNVPAQETPIKIVYFTDPICSSCWGIEPQLRRLELEYGHLVTIQYHMGGLLPKWEGFNGGGINKPSDVAQHWDEVSQHYQMPIDGDVWLEDPLSSSYPPSIAYKAAQMQDEHKAALFLRKIREMVFLEKKNITKWEHLSAAAKQSGLDVEQFKTDYEGAAPQRFRDDLALAKALGVRGFPTLFVSNQASQQQLIYGFRPYSVFEQTLLALYPAAVKKPIQRDFESLFAHFPTLTTREFAELSGQSNTEASAALSNFYNIGKLRKYTTKNGDLWIRP